MSFGRIILVGLTIGRGGIFDSMRLRAGTELAYSTVASKHWESIVSIWEKMRTHVGKPWEPFRYPRRMLLSKHLTYVNGY